MKLYTGIKLHLECYLSELKHKEPLPEDCIVFTCRSNGITAPLFAKMLGLSTARYWTGNDAWKYANIWHYRLRAKFINLFFDKHYFISEGLKHTTGLDGDVRTITTPLMYAKPTQRAKNHKFTVLYYDGTGSFKNRYGQDVFDKLLYEFPNFEWVVINQASYTQDQMEMLYNEIDLYIRPTRWDGDPFMVREALQFNVPTISTFSSDKRNISLNPERIDLWIDEIEKQYQTWLG